MFSYFLFGYEYFSARLHTIENGYSKMMGHKLDISSATFNKIGVASLWSSLSSFTHGGNIIIRIHKRPPSSSYTQTHEDNLVSTTAGSNLSGSYLPSFYNSRLLCLSPCSLRVPLVYFPSLPLKVHRDTKCFSAIGCCACTCCR